MQEHFDILFFEDNPHKAEPVIKSRKKVHHASGTNHIDDGMESLELIFGSANVIPVVVLTSSKEEKDLSESYKLGVKSYLVYPVNFESFGKAKDGTAVIAG